MSQASTVVREFSSEAPNVVGVAGRGTESETRVETMPAWQMVLVRGARVYLQTFLGLLGADGIGVIELAASVNPAWTQMANVAVLALAPATVTLLQNALEFLTRLDVNRPSLRA